MAPSAKVGASGDYEVPGEIRVSCSAVAVQVHVNTGGNGSEVRWKVSAGDGGAMPLTLRLATHSSGERVTYDVTAVDASERSSETLYEAVLLE